ncbi:hypothetical protein [Streptomyces venezuelae]
MNGLEPPEVVYEHGRIFLAATSVMRSKGDGPQQWVMRGFESSG